MACDGQSFSVVWDALRDVRHMSKLPADSWRVDQ
jgi:hypothetical protein